ncbi:MAG: B12-binding domain-containing protein [Planctomycetota bacterium]
MDDYATSMTDSKFYEAYLRALITGDRKAGRDAVADALDSGIDARTYLTEICYAAMEHVRSLYKDDKLTVVQMGLATRLNRSLVDRLAGELEHMPANGKKALIFCGNDEPEELGGQICAELFEADGWDVMFVGGDVPNDEILEMVGNHRPDLLIHFATLPQQLPNVRALIDYLRDVNSCPGMQVMCCGGVFKRAEGLAEEIGADLWADSAAAAVTVAEANPHRKASVEQQTVGKMRRVRKQAAKREKLAA